MSSVKRRFCVFSCDALDAQGVPLHRFPNKDQRPELFAAWMSAIGDKLEGLDPNRILSKRICDHHFEPASKLPKGRIIGSAVPKINLNRVQQTISSIVDMDHNYCQPRRENSQSVTLPNITDRGSSVVKNLTQNFYVQPGQEHEIKVTRMPSDPEMTPELRQHDFNVMHTLSDPDVTQISDVQIKPTYETVEEIAADLTDRIALTTDSMDVDEMSMYEHEYPSFDKNESDPSMHTGYICNMCRKDISGFRYTCMQCADWDLCSACEARTAHAMHYVLRVPSPRPYKEIQAVMAAIRHQLLSENLFLPEITDSMKVELKDEAEEPAARSEEPAAEADPLASCGLDPDDVSTSDIKEENDSLNQSMEEIETDVDDPPRKRPRLSLSPAITDQDLSHSPPHEDPTMSTRDRLADDDPAELQDPPPRKKIAIDNIKRNIIDQRRSHPTIITDRSVGQVPQKTRTLEFVTNDNLDASPLPAKSGEPDRSPTAVKEKPRQLFLRVPKGTDPSQIVKALKSKVSVRIETIKDSKR